MLSRRRFFISNFGHFEDVAPETFFNFMPVNLDEQIERHNKLGQRSYLRATLCNDLKTVGDLKTSLQLTLKWKKKTL